MSHHPVRTALGGMLALLLVVGSALGLASAEPAQAAAIDGVAARIVVDDEPVYDGAIVFESGREYSLQLQYETALLEPGQQVRLALSDGLSIADAALVVPAGNTVLERIDRNDDGTFTIVFQDPLDLTVNQGVFSLAFTVDPVVESTPRVFEVSLDDSTSSLDVVVRAPGDVFENVSDEVSKSGSGSLDSYATVSDEGVVELDEALIGHAVDYEVVVSTESALTDYRIGDTIDPALDFIVDSVTAELTTWDADGLNRSTEPFAVTPEFAPGSLVIDDLALPAAAILTVTYQAAVPDSTALGALRDRLQAEFDALEGDPGEWRVDLGNTAVFGPEAVERTATVSIGGRVTGPPMPNLGAAFGKTASILNRPAVVLDEDGTLAEPLPVDYTLTADLRIFDGVTTADFVLGRNVVVDDVLPSGVQWMSDGEPVISATVNGVDRVLTPAADLVGDPLEAIAADDRVGQYLIDGQRLLLNVGRDNTERWSIALRTELVTVAGAPTWVYDETTTAHDVVNAADFHFREDRGPHRATRTVTVLDRGDTSDGVDDPAIFEKRALDASVTTTPGARAWIDYEFRLAGNEFDAASIRLLDHADAEVFDLADLDEIAARLSGTYDGAVALTSDDFDVTIAGDGSLELSLSEEGIDRITPRGFDRPLTLRLSLPTQPFVGKETVTITNTATLVGEGLDFDYTSSAQSTATSYGDEMEVRKRVYDAEGDSWSENLRVQLDEDGGLARDEFVYRVQLIPHGSYHGVVIVPVQDVLPEGLEFLGFVDPEGVSDVDIIATESMELDGNLEATWDADADTLVIENRDGTALSRVPLIEVHFAVRLAEFDEDVAVVNSIGTTSATITATTGYPLTIAKLDAGNPARVISDPDARFSIFAADGTRVVEGAFVVDGRVVVMVDGEQQSATVPAPGTYSIVEMNAPAGYVREAEPVLVTVGGDGSSPLVRFYNTLGAEADETYAIGDVVWIDDDRDGVQGRGEEPLSGVDVVLLDADGAELARTRTDRAGRYLFDLLEAGEYRVRFELTRAQSELYRFTAQGSGTSVGGDSDADTVTGETGVIELNGRNVELVPGAFYEPADVLASVGVDPTWDAGVVRRASAALGATGSESMPLIVLSGIALLAGLAGLIIGRPRGERGAERGTGARIAD